LDNPEDIRHQAGLDPDKLAELKQWLLESDKRSFAAVVIRRGYIVLEVERATAPGPIPPRRFGFQGDLRDCAGDCLRAEPAQSNAAEDEVR